MVQFGHFLVHSGFPGPLTLCSADSVTLGNAMQVIHYSMKFGDFLVGYSVLFPRPIGLTVFNRVVASCVPPQIVTF